MPIPTTTPDSGAPLTIRAARTDTTAGETHPLTLNLTAVATVELQAAGADGAAAGPAKFSMVANTGGAMRLFGWDYPVVLDLAGLAIPSQSRPTRMNHNSSQGVGHTTSIGMQDGMLVAAGLISRETAAARDVVASAGKGFPWQASVGAGLNEDDVEFVGAGKEVLVNGRTFTGPVNVVRKSVLGEISFVDLGADDQTSVRVAAGKDGETQTAHDGDGDGGTAATADGGTAQRITRAKQERARQEGISACVEEALSFRGADIAGIEKIAAEALAEGWTVQATELALLRASRPRAPQQPSRADLPHPKVLEASLCLACGLSDNALARDRDYGEAVVTAAYPLRNRGLRGTIAAALEAAGVRVPHGSRELFNTLIEQQRIRAEGFSTVNLPGILGNVANKVLLNAFTAVQVVYDRVAEQADFSNFHTHSIYRLGVSGEFELVPKDGEIKHAKLGQDAFSNKLETYGKMLTLTRQDIINDDLNSFSSLTAQLGRKARIAVDKALVTVVMEASDVFYTVAQGNRLTGALGITELAAAEAALLMAGDVDGDPIYASPRFLLVPPGIKFLAEQIYTSQLVNNFTTSTPMPTDNPYRGRFEVLSSPFLASSSLAGYSATTWYLLTDPNVLPAYQVAFLDGRRAPTVETADAEFDTLGLQMRAFFDFGVSRLDYRGAVKNTAS